MAVKLADELEALSSRVEAAGRAGYYENWKPAVRRAAKLVRTFRALPSLDALEAQTSRNAIIEECAKVAEGWLLRFEHGPQIEFIPARRYAADAVKDIRDAIRSLASQTSREEGVECLSGRDDRADESTTVRDAFEEWAARDSRRLEPNEFEERTPGNNHYYEVDSTNEAYIGWCAALAPSPIAAPAVRSAQREVAHSPDRMARMEEALRKLMERAESWPDGIREPVTDIARSALDEDHPNG